MSDEQTEQPKTAAERILALAEEVEASGEVATGAAAVDKARADLHRWVDSVAQVVTLPSLGRVSLIHKDGGQSTIISHDLAFKMSAPKQPG